LGPLVELASDLDSYNIEIPEIKTIGNGSHLRASTALLRERIQFLWSRKASQMRQIGQLKACLQASLLQSDHQHIFTAVNSSYRHVYHKMRNTQIQKFLALQKVNHQTMTPVASTNKKFVLSLSDYVFTKAEEMVLQKGLNFGVAVMH
jgi:hypothetical protein